MDKDCLRTGDKATVHFRFIKTPEYLHIDQRLVFREGRTKAVGTITKVWLGRLACPQHTLGAIPPLDLEHSRCFLRSPAESPDCQRQRCQSLPWESWSRATLLDDHT